MIPTVRAALKPTRRAPARPVGDWSDLFARDLGVLDAGLAGALSVLNGLQELKSFARAATEPDISDDERDVQQTAYDEVIAEIEASLHAARVDGMNVLANERLDGPGDTLHSLGGPPVLGASWALERPRGSGVSVSARDRLDDAERALAVLEEVLMSFIWASGEYMRLQRAADEALETFGPALLKTMKQQPTVTGRVRQPADARTASYIAQTTQALIGPGAAIANRRPRHLLRLARPPLTQDIERLPGRVETRT
jgi:hypothetical protein